MFEVLYYYYYLFYTRIIPDSEPHATVIFSLSFVESLLINGIIDFIAVTWFCFKVGKWTMIAITALTILLNYWYYQRSGLNTTIVREKPRFFGSHKLTILLTLLGSLLVISWLFWGSIYSRSALSGCV